MQLNLSFGEFFCCTKNFTINGVAARPEDFGTQRDQDPENAPDYGCGSMEFNPIPHTSEILTKYGICEEEYKEIALRLERGLSFGRCELCS